MIGNDIVDLKLAAKESNWQRPRFLQKLFTDHEQNLIRNAKDASNMLWRLWSMKESAYKVHVQQYDTRFFAPKKIACQHVSESSGLMCIDDELYATESKKVAAYVFSSAILAKNNTAFSDYYFITKHASLIEQRQEIYHELKTIFSKKYRLTYDLLHIEKSVAGAPKVFYNNNRLDVSFSMTHHGKYAAISILNP